MALKRIHHIDIFVDNIEKISEHFIDKLGFQPVKKSVHVGKSIELAIPAGEEVRFEFHEMTEEYRKTHQKEMAYGKPDIDHIGFEVDDINKEFEELKSKGVEFKSTPQVNPLGRKLCRTVDADGRGWLQLYEEGK